MRNLAVGALLVVFVSQSAGAASAAPQINVQDLLRPLQALLSGTGSQPAAQSLFTQRTPLPLKPAPDYASRERYARMIPKPLGEESRTLVARPIDLVKLQKQRASTPDLPQLEHNVTSQQARPSISQATPAPSTTGIWPWWTYQGRNIPGVGQAMVNVSTLNFLIAENDVDVPAGGIDLAFRRVYNSQSKHNATNDDNSTPSVFGNRWTNNLDVHLAWSSTSPTEGVVSVYTGDGARDDYNCEIDVVNTCTATTPEFTNC